MTKSNDAMNVENKNEKLGSQQSFRETMEKFITTVNAATLKEVNKKYDIAVARRDDEAVNGDSMSVQYWVGYIDGLEAVRRMLK